MYLAKVPVFNHGVQNNGDIDLMKAPICALRYNNTQFNNVLEDRIYDERAEGLSVPIGRLKDNVELEAEEECP